MTWDEPLLSEHLHDLARCGIVSDNYEHATK